MDVLFTADISLCPGVEGKLLDDIRAATKSGIALVMKGLKMNWHH
jgi:hypothetical protein